MLKKTWNRKFGSQEIITKESSSLEMLEVDMVKLRSGENVSYDEKGKEYALVLLGGSCTVTGADFSYEKIGRRASPFDGPATALYIPKDHPYTIAADTDVTIAVCKSPSSLDCAPALVRPEDVITAVLEKSGASSAEITAVCLDAPTHTAVLCGADGKVLRPAIYWTDSRSFAETASLRNRAESLILEQSFHRIDTIWTLPQLAWVKANEPEVWGKVQRIFFAKDYLRWRLTGVYATDFIEAQGSMLFDCRKNCWSPELCALIGLDRSLLPPLLHPSFFHPYLSGELTPYADPLLRGSFVGIRAGHTRGHFSRAVLEGVAYSLLFCKKELEALGIAHDAKARVIGGGAKSPLWRQIVSDMLGMPLLEVENSDSSLGAAMLAGVSCGIFSDYDAAVERCVRIRSCTEPDAAVHGTGRSAANSGG